MPTQPEEPAPLSHRKGPSAFHERLTRDQLESGIEANRGKPKRRGECRWEGEAGGQLGRAGAAYFSMHAWQRLTADFYIHVLQALAVYLARKRSALCRRNKRSEERFVLAEIMPSRLYLFGELVFTQNNAMVTCTLLFV